jgi:uncharacterized protein YcfL
MIKYLFLFLSSLFIFGCSSTKNIKWDELQYGQTPTQVEKIIQTRTSPVFKFENKDKEVFRCQKYYYSKNYIHYYFLFKDGRLISLIQGNQVSAGAFFFHPQEDDELPMRNGAEVLIEDFFPAPDLAKVDFKKFDFYLRKEERKSYIRAVGGVSTVYPITLPGIPIALVTFAFIYPFYNFAAFDTPPDMELGILYPDVVKKLGDPFTVYGDVEKYGIITYFPGEPTCGIKKSRLEWICYYDIFKTRRTHSSYSRRTRRLYSCAFNESASLTIPKFLADEGYLIIIPTYMGGGTGAMAGSLIGMPLRLALLPYDLLVRPFTEKDSLFRLPRRIAAMSDDIGYRTGQYIFGMPFYVIKKSLWDAPLWGFNAVFNDNPNPCEKDIIGKWSFEDTGESFTFLPDKKIVTSEKDDDNGFKERKGRYSVDGREINCEMEDYELTFILYSNELILIEPMPDPLIKLRKSGK